MRNWNCDICGKATISICSFRSYLWGIETDNDFDNVLLVRFCSDLTYEELKLGESASFLPLDKFVQILPMRNWNNEKIAELQKSNMFRSYLWGIETSNKGVSQWRRNNVQILPMRNWNTNVFISLSPVSTVFRSYLWGIETRKGRIELFKWFVVQILPMRNWNQCEWYEDTDLLDIVQILPMRNWNDVAQVTDFQVNGSCSDLTYEELKLKIAPMTACSAWTVQILPMRNWNFLWKRNRSELEIKFRSYLWGIETNFGV